MSSTPRREPPERGHHPLGASLSGRYTGEVAERLNAPVSKTGMGGSVHRGFESLPLRWLLASGLAASAAQPVREVGASAGDQSGRAHPGRVDGPRATRPTSTASSTPRRCSAILIRTSDWRVTLMTAEQTTRVGLLGVGLMGSAMAHRLLNEGIDVVAWDRDPSHVQEL